MTSRILRPLAFTVLALAGMACSASEIELTRAQSQVNNGYPNGDATSVTVRATLKGNDYLAGSLTDLNAWGSHSTVASVWGQKDVAKSTFVSGAYSFSDGGVATFEKRYGVAIGHRFESQGTVVSVGIDNFSMRGGGSSNGLVVQAAKYFKSMPLVAQLSYASRNAKPGNHRGDSVTVAATYGHQRNWTLTVGAGVGKVGYEAIGAPSAVADYTSVREFATLKKWITSDTGFTLGLDLVQSEPYDRSEIKAGVFHSF